MNKLLLNNQLIDQMKKILFYASLVALATSCTQDETLSLDVQNESKGITFELAEQIESRIQYEENNAKGYSPFWYAEKDRITIWGTGVSKDGSDYAEGDWSAFAANAVSAQYKATKSKKSAEFTSVSDAETLEFYDSSTEMGSKFFAVYPYNLGYTIGSDANGFKIESPVLGSLNTQTIDSKKGQNKAITMIAKAEVDGQLDYESVGEKVQLKYSYATPVLRFATKGLNNRYQTAFGNLKKITLTSYGYDKDGNGSYDPLNDIEPTALYYSGTPTINVNTTTWENTIEGTVDPSQNQIEVNIGLAWSDDALAPVAVAVQDRYAYRTKGVKELLNARFEFANIDLDVQKEIDVDFNIQKNFVGYRLEMNQFNFLVTKGGSDTRTLFVINGDFSGILTEDGTAIDWQDTQTDSELKTAVDFTEIETVYVEKDVVLDAEDFKLLNKMTNVKSLTLNGNTAIPAESLQDLTALEEIVLPEVTSVGNDAFASPELKIVNMPKFAFNSGIAINEMLLKKDKLEELVMGATNMNASFPANGLLLTDYTYLKEVTVNDGIKLGANSFKGCTALTTVNGTVDIVGIGAFQNCDALTSVTVSDKDIVDYTFSGCDALANVYYNDGTATAPLKPNYVGAYAFEDTKVNLDLSETNIIAKGAFKNAKSLVGYEYKNQIVVKVGATSIGVGAFSGANAIQFIYFMNATSINDYMLSGTTALQEIKFGKAFTFAGENKPNDGTFGTSANIKLFVVEGQTGIAGNTLTIGPAGKTNTFVFTQVETEAAE